MSENEFDLQPVTHITADAIGQPGKRVFYIQAWQEQRTVTLIVEKVQLQSLAVGYEQFLGEIQQRFPDLDEATVEYQEDQMRIHPPVDPLFRVGEVGLGYDAENDLVVLVMREIAAEPQPGEGGEFSEGNETPTINETPEGNEGDFAGKVVRFWCTRSQVRAMCRWGIEIAARGRPLCPQCGEPMEPEGHFCPKRNGHKH